MPVIAATVDYAHVCARSVVLEVLSSFSTLPLPPHVGLPHSLAAFFVLIYIGALSVVREVRSSFFTFSLLSHLVLLPSLAATVDFTHNLCL